LSEFGRLATPAWESYRILADNSLDVVMEADPATNFTWVSPSVTEVLGWRPDELIGLSAVDIVHPDDMASLREHADQMNSVSSTEDAARAVRYDKIRMRNSSGDYRTLSFRGACPGRR
jgi:PAS domain S-box-containing protein